MDESSMIERLRFDADQIETDDTDVDALVGGALLQGRRRRTRRRAGAALGAVVAAAVLVAVVAGGVVPTRLGSPQPDPVATPVIATPVIATPVIATPVPSPTEPSPSVAPSTSGRLSGTPAQVQATLVSLLPNSITVTRAVSDSGSVAEGPEHDAYLDLSDTKGTSNLVLGVGGGRFSDVCVSNHPCTRKALPNGGTLWFTGGPDPDKAGEDRSAFYNRPDGGRLFLTQTNFVDGNGPVTRTGLPLTDAEIRMLLTGTAWDRYFRG